MIKNFFEKLKNRFLKFNNGFFQNYLYELKIDKIKKVRPKLPIQQKLINQNNYKKTAEVTNIESYKKKSKKMLDQGQIGIMAIYNNHIVGFSWAYVGKIFNKINKNKKAVNHLIHLNDNEALIHFCRTAEYYRGNRIYSFLLSKLSNILFSRYKIKNIYIDTDIENIPSQKGIKKVGFEKKYLVKRLKLLGFFIFKKFQKINFLTNKRLNIQKIKK